MIEKRVSPLEPQQVEAVFNHFRQRSSVLAFDVEMTDDGQYEYSTVTIPPGMFTYDGIVNILISERYPSDVMQAIVNNYLYDQADDNYRCEFDNMQKWRAHAKEIAREALNAI